MMRRVSIGGPFEAGPLPELGLGFAQRLGLHEEALTFG